MKKYLKMTCVLAVILTSFALVLAGCEQDTVEAVQNQNEDSSIKITQQTRNESYFSLEDPITISVTAMPDGVTYRWFINTTPSNTGGEPIEGATGREYTFTPTERKEHFFYVEITLTTAEQTVTKASDPITITIAEMKDLESQNMVTVTQTKKQYVRGFGGMSTPWSNAPDDNLDDFEKMYNPENLGYNIARIMIPPDNTDIDEMMRALVANETRFSGTDFYKDNRLPVKNKRHDYYYEKVKIVNKYNGYVLATPWSPPAEWKTNGKTAGGGDAFLKKPNYDEFADYLRRYAQIMYEKGAPIYTLSLQNEWTYPDGDYEGCLYTDTEHANWWKAEGGFLEGVKGWGGGRQISSVQAMSGEAHNEITRLNTVLAPGVREFIDLYGRHIYSESRSGGISTDLFKNSAQFNSDDPKEIWMTEHNINSGSNGYDYDSTWPFVWFFMNDIDFTLRLNDESAFIWWTAKRFYSMLGDATYGTTDGQILPRGYGMSHYAKFAKETGRVDVTVSGSAAGVNPTSYSNSNTGPKISAFVTLNDDFYAETLETRHKAWRNLSLSNNNIKAISLVMYTPTRTDSSSGTDMGTVKIKLPDGFKIRSVTAMRSTSDNGGEPVYEPVTVGSDLNTAYVTLPASNILSVRFTK